MTEEEVVVVGNDPPPFVANGVTFDGKHSYSDFGLWLSERPDTGSPEPKLNTIEISGADGIIDLTEANAGEVKFSNRTMKFTFAAMVAAADQESFKATIMNALHGKVVNEIILDEDNGWVYNGRAKVEFKNITPWKLRCQVTVDAAPYAMKKTITTVDLTTGSASVQRVDLALNTQGATSTFSEFLLGTKEFPDGLPVNNQQVLNVEWDYNAQYLQSQTLTRTIQVVDSEGHVYNRNFTFAEVSPYDYIEIPYTALTNAGIVLNKVYRVVVSLIRGCSLYVEAVSVKKTVTNIRKTVIPEFALTANNSVAITVNGVEYSIPVGVSSSFDLKLGQGDNVIFVPSLSGDVTQFTMSFREGKL